MFKLQGHLASLLKKNVPGLDGEIAEVFTLSSFVRNEFIIIIIMFGDGVSITRKKDSKLHHCA
jgi:hypothetical protein